MNRRRLIPLALILPLALTSCGGTVTHEMNEYYFEETYTSDYRIMQMTDIHFGVTTNLTKQAKWFDKLISAANPNYIFITGDSFMDASTREVDFLYDYMESTGLPWSITWGNHDKQGWYAPSYPVNKLKDYKNVNFVNYTDDIYGDGNFFIDLKDSTGTTIWRLIALDSNSYYNTGSTSYEYDVIHQDQIEWYKKAVAYENPNNTIPSVVFIHIPLTQYTDAWTGAQAGTYEYTGEKREGSYPGYEDSGLYEAITSITDADGKPLSRAVFCGHDHINNAAVDYNDVILSYGVKSTNLIYHDDDIIGCQVITLPSDGSFGLNNLERIFMTYDN